MRALVLHLFSDALGSLAVIITSATIWLSGASWTNYLDPVASLLIVLLTTIATVPVLRSAAVILMQVRARIQ